MSQEAQIATAAPPPLSTRLILYVDGASRGNPGPAAYGVFSSAGIAESVYIGETTNNVAEWRGLIAALEAAAARGATDVEIRADSELVVKQFRGEYRVKAAHLAPLVSEARRRSARIPRLVLVHVPRAQNREADRLANAALDERARAARGGA